MTLNLRYYFINILHCGKYNGRHNYTHTHTHTPIHTTTTTTTTTHTHTPSTIDREVKVRRFFMGSPKIVWDPVDK